MHEALSIYIQVCKVYISIYIQVYIIAVRFPTIESAQLVELIQTVMDEKITLCEYTTQSFMFYIFVRYTFLFYLKNKGKIVIEYKILKYRKLKMI